MEIGSKIKNARNKAKMTQEQVAEALGVSRQTISNWENQKSYPDIISVIKMSDLYAVSLDYLLKGEEPMSNYMEYLEESTNVVKSKNKFSKLILMITYLVIWAVSLCVFWVFKGNLDAMGYSLMILWGVMPVTTFVISLLIGKSHYWGNKKWFSALVFGVMYMLTYYMTFSLANMRAFDKFNLPNIEMILYGALISFAGLGIGHLIYKSHH